MKLEQQVSNKELSVRLRDLGVKQESLFYWTRPPESDDIYVCWYWENMSTASGETVDWEQISAFTVAELGEMLWTAFEKAGWDLLYKAYGEVFDFKGTQRIGDLGIVNLMRKPDMAAKMLIYLIENKLITI